MARRRRKGKPALVYIPSGPNSRSGAVYLEGDFPEFKLRCTVRGCRWRATEAFYVDAQRMGFAHAAEHLWPKERKGPLVPPGPPLMREVFRLYSDDDDTDEPPPPDSAGA